VPDVIDLKWMSGGGLMLDSRGDLAVETDPLASIIDIIRTRLRSAVRGWQLYEIGAGLEDFVGEAITEELESRIRRRVVQALTRDFLTADQFDVETLVYRPGEILVVVYLDRQAVARATISRDGVRVE